MREREEPYASETSYLAEFIEIQPLCECNSIPQISLIALLVAILFTCVMYAAQLGCHTPLQTCHSSAASPTVPVKYLRPHEL